MKGTPSHATLAVGPLWFVDGSAQIADTDPLVLIDVPRGAVTAGAFAGRPANTMLVNLRHVADTPARPATVATVPDSPVPIAWSALFTRMFPGAELSALLGRDSAAPVFLAVTSDGDPGRLHLYGKLRYSDNDVLFVRLTEEPVPAALHGVPRRWLREAARLHGARELFLNNHQSYYFRMFPGEELEYKYTFDNGDIWTSAIRLYNELRDGALAGFIVEYGDEFQTWDSLNYLFEIPGPSDEKGYISFCPLGTGGYAVKRKWFGEDAMRRGEKLFPEPGEIPDFETYITERFGVTGVRLPPFRRVRYDVNFESLATGNVFAILFDQSTVLDSAAVLRQCELEYVRTRSVLPADEELVLREFDEITEWLEAYLPRIGIKTSRGVYSKLSFLKDTVRAIENAQAHLS